MSVVTRTNLATNPSAATTATNYGAVAGTGGTAAIAWNAGLGYLNVPGYPRVTWSAATTAVSGGISYTQTGLSAATSYGAQIWVRCSKAQTLALQVVFQDASSTVVNTVVGASVAVSANTWTQLTVTGVSGAAVTNAVFTAQAVAGGTNWANGDWLDGEAICAETVTAPRTNLIQNPSCGAGTTSYSTAAGTGGVVATSNPATGGFSGASFYRATWTTGTSAASGWMEYFGLSTSGLTAGNTYTFSGYVRPSTGVSMYLRVNWWNGSASTGTVQSSTIALPANVWTRVSVIAATAPAGTVGAYIDWFFTTTIPTGATVDLDAVMVEQSSTLGNYFDGSTPATSTLQYAWAGAPNASASIQTAVLGPYFDGSYVSANSVVYAWTGTANASTSTAATYTPVLSVVAKTDAPCPRVEVTVTDLSPTTNTVTVWRTADGRRQAVRGARKRSMVSADFVIDYESPLNRALLYELEVVAGVNAQAAVTPATTTVTSTYWWIQDPLIPSSAIAMDVAKGDRTRPSLARASLKNLEYASASSIVPILGSPDPVALMGQRLSAGNIMFDMFTSMAQVTTQFRALLQQTPLLLVRSTGLRNDGMPGLAYFNAAKPVECPVTVPFGGTLTEWKLTGDLVAAPTMNVLVPIWTYGNVAALWATYQQAQTAMTGKTYLDALKSPAGT